LLYTDETNSNTNFNGICPLWEFDPSRQFFTLSFLLGTDDTGMADPTGIESLRESGDKVPFEPFRR
jgi:hypothetical protein